MNKWESGKNINALLGLNSCFFFLLAFLLFAIFISCFGMNEFRAFTLRDEKKEIPNKAKCEHLNVYDAKIILGS